jgi:hypothetical protein
VKTVFVISSARDGAFGCGRNWNVLASRCRRSYFLVKRNWTESAMGMVF